jgi:DNA-binding GntR family transcriptional regulator
LRIQTGSKQLEQDLAQRFGASKTPVRDALHRLQMEGLVEILPRKAYRVLSISLEDFLELHEMRLVLERACIKLTCRPASDASLRDLELYRDGPSGPRMQQWLAYDRDFHSARAVCCGNDRLTRTTQNHLQAFERLLRVSVIASGLGLFRSIVQDHFVILNAVQARNVRKASSLIRAHIEASRKRFLEAFGRRGNRFGFPLAEEDRCLTTAHRASV